jgi:hypothetical protein
VKNKRTTSRNRRWDAWAGDITAIRSLAKTINECVQERHKDILDSVKERIETIENADKRGLGYDQLMLESLRQRAQELEAAENNELVILKMFDKYEEVYGEVNEVLAELDRRSTRCLVFAFDVENQRIRSADAFPSYHIGDGVQVRLGMDTNFRDSGADIIVSSPSTGWARSSFARISDEVEKGVPRWSSLRRYLFSVFALLFATAVMIGTFPHINSKDKTAVTLVFGLVALFLAGMLVIAEDTRLVSWVFPRFELTGEGAQSSGTRRMIAVTATLISIPVGVLINLIS